MPHQKLPSGNDASNHSRKYADTGSHIGFYVPYHSTCSSICQSFVMYFIIFTNKMVIISHLSCRSLLIIYKNYIIRKKCWHITPALFQTQNLTYSAFYIVWICHIVIFITEQADIPLTVSWSTRFCASCPKIRHPAVYTVFSGYHIIPCYFLLYDIILPVYRHSGISGMSYDYHTFTGLFWHIFIIYPEIRHNCPHPAPETGHTDHVGNFRTAVTRYLQSAILFLRLSSGSVWVISELSECCPVAGAYPHPAQFTCRRILWGRTYTGTDWCSLIRTLLQNRSCQFPSYEIWYMIYISGDRQTIPVCFALSAGSDFRPQPQQRHEITVLRSDRVPYAYYTISSQYTTVRERRCELYLTNFLKWTILYGRQWADYLTYLY